MTSPVTVAFIRNAALFVLLGALVLTVLPGCIDRLESLDFPDPGHAPDSPLEPYEVNERLGRGINLGNALEAPTEGAWGMTVEEEYLQLISDAGFRSVRIPIRWNAHARDEAPYIVESDFFDRIDQVVHWALDRDLIVVIDFHHYNELMDQSLQHRQRFLSIWEQIAEHYRDYPQTVLFEVLNEPHNNLEPDLWNEYLRSALDVIRESNPNRTVIIGTAPWGGIEGLQYLSLPEDDRHIIATVHYYNPFQFTHQGAGWVNGADEWGGTTWTGTEEQKAAVDQDFDEVEEWSIAHDRPVYVGEFGAYGAAPPDSRVAWTTHVRETIEDRNFSWAYWEFGAGFGIYDRENNRWRADLLEALIPDSPELDVR